MLYVIYVIDEIQWSQVSILYTFFYITVVKLCDVAYLGL